MYCMHSSARVVPPLIWIFQALGYFIPGEVIQRWYYSAATVHHFTPGKWLIRATFILNRSIDLPFTCLLHVACHSVGVLLFLRNFCSALHRELVLCSKEQYGLIKLLIYVANKLKMPVLMFWPYWKVYFQLTCPVFTGPVTTWCWKQAPF